MGKDLHYSLFPFWEKALNNHQNVDSWELIEEDNYYFYQIKRVGSLSDIALLVSDEYRYIIDDYVNDSDELLCTTSKNVMGYYHKSLLLKVQTSLSRYII